MLCYRNSNFFFNIFSIVILNKADSFITWISLRVDFMNLCFRLWSYCPILCGKHRIIKNYRDNLTPRLTLSSSRADLCLLPAALQPSQITLIQSVIKAIGSWASGPAAASLFPIHSYWSRVWGRLTVPLPFWHAPNFDA